MSISDLIQSMTDAGAPIEAVLIAVRAIEAKDQEQADKRRKAAERKQRERDRKRDSHATVTGQSQAKKEKNQKKKTTPLGYTPKGDISSSPQGGTKKRACRIPADWKPDRDYAEAKGLSSQQIDIEAEKFRNYWQSASGQRATKSDWAATWRNWVLNAVDRQPRGQSPPNRAAEREQATNDSFARVERELAEASEQGDISSVFAPSRYQN